MWKNVIVPERRHDRHDKIIVRVGIVDVVSLAKDLDKLGDDELVESNDLLVRSRVVLVVVVSRGIARPDDEVDVILDVVVDPLESRIYQAERTITTGDFRPVVPGRPFPGVTLIIWRRVEFVEGVGMNVCQGTLAAVRRPEPRNTCDVQKTALQLPGTGASRLLRVREDLLACEAAQ